jgi:hypothetical protein
MKTTKVLTVAIATALIAAASLGAQKATIDARINTRLDGAQDARDYFNWSIGNAKVPVKDSFDPEKVDAAHGVTGASVAASTARFDNAVRWDRVTTKKSTIPTGFRGVLLFPVGSQKTKDADNLLVTPQGKTLVITYVHNGVAYKITTDTGGNADLASSFKKASVGDNVGGVFQIRGEYLKAGGDPTVMADLDLAKVTWSPDVADSAASRKYTGKVKFTLDKAGILTIRGTINAR